MRAHRRPPPNPTDAADLLKDRVPVVLSIHAFLISRRARTSILHFRHGLRKLAEQEKLGPTDEPVLTIKELASKRAALDKIPALI